MSVWMPNTLKVYPDGTVCISILHTPGDDPTMYEQASERWSPVQSVEKVILSVISMLAGQFAALFLCPPIYYVIPEPNLESGANIDCCKLYRDNRAVSPRSDVSHDPLISHPACVYGRSTSAW